MIDAPDLRDPYQRPQRLPAWGGDLLIAVAMTIVTFSPLPGEPYEPRSLLTIAMAAIMALVLPLRRRRPFLALALVFLAFAAGTLGGGLNPSFALALAIALHGVTTQVGRRPGLYVTGSTVILAAATIVIGTSSSVLGPLAIQFALAIVVGAAVGDASRSRWAYISAVTERAQRAEESKETEARRRVAEERLKIARDLHDAVAHQIAVISLNASVASSSFDKRPETAEESLTTIRSAARVVLGEIGDLLTVLRTDEDDEPPTPQPGFDRLQELVRQFGSTGLDVTVRTEGDTDRIVGAVSLVAYRIIQEGLANAHKHGSEHRAHVLVAVEGDVLSVVVTNPVAGASPPGPGSRQGLTGLRERVSSIRGHVDAGPAAGGWRLSARLPLTKDDTA